jgi:hypothetical protein
MSYYQCVFLSPKVLKNRLCVALGLRIPAPLWHTLQLVSVEIHSFRDNFLREDKLRFSGIPRIPRIPR